MILTDVSLKRPVFATVVILVMVILGAMSFGKLSIEEYPPMEFPYVGVMVTQPGASPDQLEQKVIKPIEDALGEINGVKHIYGEGSDGWAMVFAEFTMETNSDVATQSVRDKISGIRGTLPKDIEEPVIERFKMSDIPIMQIAVSGNLSSRELTYYVNNIIKKKIRTVNGVGSIKSYGGNEREIHVYLDANRLAAYGIATSDIVNVLQSGNVGVPAGNIADNKLSISVKTAGELTSIEALKAMPIAKRNGQIILLKDIATVSDGTKEATSFARVNGKNALGIDIIKQSGANTVKVADQINAAIEEARAQLPKDVKISVVKDNSLMIRGSVHNVIETLIEGALLAVLIVFIFLHNAQTTMISAIAIPTSIISTFFFMNIMGFTLNSMSLGALSLCVGLLIDDAIVVIENIERHKKMGKTTFQAVKEATSEIGLAVFATTMAIVAVFLPIGTMKGVTGQFFKQFGLTAVFAVLISMFVSFTVVPMLAAREIKGKTRENGRVGRYLMRFNSWFDRLSDRYAIVLKVVLKHRIRTLALAFGLFVASLFMVSFLGSEFMTRTDIGEINISLRMDAGTSVDGADAITKKAEQLLKTFPEVQVLYTTVQQDNSSIFVKIVPKNKRKQGVQEIANAMRSKLQVLTGVEIAIATGESGGGGQGFQLSILGDDPAQMRAYAEKIESILDSIPGAVDVNTNYKSGRPQEKLVIDYQAASDTGVSPAQIGETLNTLYTGTVVGKYQEGNTRSDIRLQLAPSERKNFSALQLINLQTTDGKSVPLGQVTNQVFEPSPSSVTRIDRKNEIKIQANFVGTTLGEFDALFNEQLEEKIQLPDNLSYYAGGDMESMNEMTVAMTTAILLGAIFIFFVLASQFESWLEPFAIMFSLPMAVIGAFGGLLIMKSSLSIDSLIGLIFLMGLVTKNAILLVDYVKSQRALGMDRSEAMIKAGQVRLRPIIMTTMAMIGGMFPLALGIGEGGEARASMAYAIIGGLVTSTLLTLVVVPVAYTVLDDFKIKCKSLKNRLVHRHQQVENSKILQNND